MDDRRSSPPPDCRQMPTYHLKTGRTDRASRWSISAWGLQCENATDHNLRFCAPHAWLMVGPALACATAEAGGFRTGHAYCAKIMWLDERSAVWVAHPALAEIQIALEKPWPKVTQAGGLRPEADQCAQARVATITTIATGAARQSGPVHRLKPGRAQSPLDM